MSKLELLLELLDRAEKDLVLELRSVYRTGAKIRAKIQSNRGPDKCVIVRVIGERPGFLLVKYESTGYETTVHCTDVLPRVGPCVS